MICSITPQEHHKYEYLLAEAFLKCDLQYADQATYFVALDECFGVCGLAKLAAERQVWELSEVHILISEEIAQSYSEIELAVFAGRFYHELFEALLRSARKQEIHQVLMVTAPETVEDAENVGWPLRGTVGDDHIYLDISQEGYWELLSNRKLFEENLGDELFLPKHPPALYN